MFSKNKDLDITSFYTGTPAHFVLPHTIAFSTADELAKEVFAILKQPLQVYIGTTPQHIDWSVIARDSYFINVEYINESVQEYWDNFGFLDVVGGLFNMQVFKDFIIVNGGVPYKWFQQKNYISELDVQVYSLLNEVGESKNATRLFYNAVWQLALDMGATEMLLTNSADLEYLDWSDNGGFYNAPISYNKLKLIFEEPVTDFEELEKRLSGNKWYEYREDGIYWKAACRFYNTKPFK